MKEIFGKDNLLIRVYEKNQYEGKEKSLISDFFNTIGLELTEKYNKVSKYIANISLKGVYVEAKRRLNFFDATKKKNMYIAKLFLKAQKNNTDNIRMTSNVYFKSQKHMEEYMSTFEASNSMVAKEFLGRQNGVLFYEQPKEITNEQLKQYKDEDIIKVLSEIILFKIKEKKS